MKMTESHRLRSEASRAEATRLCMASKDLWNHANNIVLSVFTASTESKKNGDAEHATYLNYNAINRMMIDRCDPTYTALPRKVSNQTLMLLDKAWRGFFASMRSWKRDPSKFLGMPRMPGFRSHKRGGQTVTYEFGAISKKRLKKGFVSPSGTSIEVPFVHGAEEGVRLLGCRIVPLGDGEYKLDILYERTWEDKVEGRSVHAAIDLGVDNLATVVFDDGSRPAIVSGRTIKSENRFWNKQRAALLAALQASDARRRSSKRMRLIDAKHGRRMESMLHEASRCLVDELVFRGASDLIIGYNKNWKQDADMGSKNNQKFVGIPHERFVSMVEYKCELSGIRTRRQEESYTSKASFLDLDPMPTFADDCAAPKFSGYRSERAWYKRKGHEQKVHADVNGAYNILRKVIPAAFVKGISGFAVSPARLRSCERHGNGFPLVC